MTDLIEVRASNLVGAALDWAVAIVTHGKGYGGADSVLCPPEGAVEMNEDDGTLWVCSGGFHPKGHWSPSTDWSQGGPLIDKHGGSVQHDRGVPLSTRYSAGPDGDAVWCYGPTPLIAFCRGLVRYKIGDTVQVPKELVQ